MDGYTEGDMAKFFKTNIKNIISVLNTAANRIKDINGLEWKYNYIYMNKLKANFEYKTCTSCKELKPSSRDFFSKDNRNNDELKNTCKKCDINRKN